MFIIAARKIAAGEEITISYFDTLISLFRRELICRRMGFECDCKRCMLERSLVIAEESPLQEIAEIVDSMDPTILSDAKALSDLELWATAMRVENTIDVLTIEEK
ncbi:hypothetical protein SUGI_0406750 [Cryptomeria japonica]|nr:hypothetical protein SUGI_0406750 [Cryptomeria japonica]